MVSWCSWLSHVSNTHKVPRSSLGEIIPFVFCAVAANRPSTWYMEKMKPQTLAQRFAISIFPRSSNHAVERKMVSAQLYFLPT
jgi:hypothetical protein